jgi:hypothetical protein
MNVSVVLTYLRCFDNNKVYAKSHKKRQVTREPVKRFLDKPGSRQPSSIPDFVIIILEQVILRKEKVHYGTSDASVKY